jgi:hypothetical protein
MGTLSQLFGGKRSVFTSMFTEIFLKLNACK